MPSAPGGHVQLGAADGDPSWGRMGLGWASPGCPQGLEVLREPSGRDSAQGPVTPAPVDVRCERLCCGEGSLSPRCCVFPYGPGMLILHPNIALPIFELPFPESSSPRLPPPRCTPQQLPKCLCPTSLPQRAGPTALAPQGLPRACVPHPTLAPRAAPRQRFPKPASSEGPPALATLPAPQSSLPPPRLFPSWTGMVLGQRLPGPGGPRGDAGKWCLSSRSCAGGVRHVHPPPKCFGGRQDTGSSLWAEAGLPQGRGDPCRGRRCFAGDWIL